MLKPYLKLLKMSKTSYHPCLLKVFFSLSFLEKHSNDVKYLFDHGLLEKRSILGTVDVFNNVYKKRTISTNAKKANPGYSNIGSNYKY